MNSKTFVRLGALAIAVLNGLALTVGGSATPALVGAGIAVAVALLAVAGLGGANEPAAESPRPAPAPSAPQPVPVAPPPPAPPPAEAEVLALLGALQAKGRFIDFLMDDVSRYTDAQVGAAARVVQQGCKAALADNVEIVPVSAEREGTTIAVPVGDAAQDYRLVGHVAGEPPYRGKLVHKGWKAARVTLPRVVAGDRLPPIAPAQVELK